MIKVVYPSTQLPIELSILLITQYKPCPVLIQSKDLLQFKILSGLQFDWLNIQTIHNPFTYDIEGGSVLLGNEHHKARC